MNRLTFTLILLACSLTIQAQEWRCDTIQGDELKEIPTQRLHSYTDSTFFFEYWEMFQKFVLSTASSTFAVDKKGNITVLVGYYNLEGALEYKTKLKFHSCSESHNKIETSVKDIIAVYKVLNCIHNRRGYVRFVANRSSCIDFDFKVPCKKH